MLIIHCIWRYYIQLSYFSSNNLWSCLLFLSNLSKGFELCENMIKISNSQLY